MVIRGKESDSCREVVIEISMSTLPVSGTVGEVGGGRPPAVGAGWSIVVANVRFEPTDPEECAIQAATLSRLRGMFDMGGRRDVEKAAARKRRW